MQRPDVTAFFDEPTNTVSYIVTDPDTRKCAVIDSVLDFDQASGRTSTRSAEQIISYIKEQELDCEWIIDTHVHADHLTASRFIKSNIGGKTAIGEKIAVVQDVFKGLFNEGQSFHTDGSQFDHLFTDGEIYHIGNIEAQTLHTPGHTPACMSHVIGDAVFVGDTLFMPDYGSARCDFPGGDAGVLYDSIQKLFQLPDEMRMYLCHDYQPEGRNQYVWETTIGEQKTNNIHLGHHASREAFIKMRTERDATLDMPKLILPSVQINMRAGAMPPAEENGVSYMKLPINLL